MSSLATKAEFNSQGFWTTKTTEQISYTRDGHNSIREDELNSFWFSHRQKCLIRLIDNKLEGPVLDVGGGNGVFSKHLQSVGIDSILLEPAISGVRNAVENGVKNVVNGSLFDAGLISSSISSVVLLDVLEHIGEEENFLIELNRILKVQGKLILTVPAYQFLFSDFDKEVGHFRRYTLKQLDKKLIKAGFEVDYKSYFFSFLPVPILIGRFMINKFKSKTKRKSTGHISKSGLAGFILRILLWPELLMVKHRTSIPFGSSCLIVAHKLKNVN